MKIETATYEVSAALAEQLPADILPEIAFSGRSNVGKSTLINRLLGRKNLARTSATPGKTAMINFYRLSTLRMVDLPGYGYAKVPDKEKRRWRDLIGGYFAAGRDLRLVLQLIDMRHPPTADDRQMLEYMVEEEIPFMVVLTKADKLNKTQYLERLQAFETFFEEEYEGVQYLPFSSITGEGVETLREIIESVTEEG
jgi:GTP-binding protein